eukprot:CAMPEP_0171057830 /NCGR_PEP_ID=MMETSP0766_2-20121228/2066_1 /TAXON_ID=439317 /ORGANISM="Gambierdiscus australes, Strain CAWD 149" /LENGTH=312 /DNA_ID=CAMNT_0011513019 /DNA_START=63 /DNA_END=1001 /DNA_ORIENTATION=+
MTAQLPVDHGPVKVGLTLWPQDDWLRLLGLLQTHDVLTSTAVCTAVWLQLRAPAAIMRKVSTNPGKYEHLLEAEQALARLELAMAQADQAMGTQGERTLTWESSSEALGALETSLHTEMRYVYGLDWEMKPGKLVSKKGTWLKTNTCFSWELNEGQKLYLPQGVVMPVLQIGKVVDPVELKRHDWVPQHLRVWMRPAIVRTLEARRGAWFIYWPHWEDKGLAVVALSDTWLKRTTQMSGELQPFELIYVPKGLPVRLAEEASVVNEEWEKHRHQHVHMHRKVMLAAAPLTVKQDQYDIFVGQGDARLAAPLR